MMHREVYVYEEEKAYPEGRGGEPDREREQSVRECSVTDGWGCWR